uniref:Man1/Src1-like C-terminal domain-containing protein n=1 Tax=Eptatretus burgeri TaxID=7764 RepID=A0A8C4Q678_EPTBU
MLAFQEKRAESFRKLYIMLAQKKGNYQCGYSNSSQISLADLKKMDDFQGYNDDMLKTLMTGTYKDNFIITGENGKPVDSFEKVVFLESPFSQKSILCRIHTALCKVIFRLLCMFVGFAVIWALVLYIRFWLKQREELRKQAFDLVDRIAALLQAQAEESQTVSFMEPYMSVLHVRDSLIQPRDRARLMKVWKMADNFISSHRESRIRTEYQVVNGEDCEVWRWVPGPSSPKTSRISYHL